MGHGLPGEPGTMGAYDAACEEILRLGKQNTELLEALKKLTARVNEVEDSDAIHPYIETDYAEAAIEAAS